MNRVRDSLLLGLLVTAFTTASHAAERPVRLSGTVENLLVRATLSGNLESFGKGLRGAPDHLVYDPRQAGFVQSSQWHEYGVGFGQDLGVVPQQQPAWWMAEWTKPVEANWISLTGVYPNQPQADTAWKIELRRDGQWSTHASGDGDWYNGGRYVWGGPGAEVIKLDAIRISVFSKDNVTPIRSVHFRGEPGRSWIVARLTHDDVVMPAPFQARITPLTAPVMAGEPVRFDGSGSTITAGEFMWDFGEGSQAEGKQVEHRFERPGIRKVTLTVSDGKHRHTGMAIVRVHTPQTLHVPQVHLDTDQKNEQDDQHYFGYALFSELDVLGVNSVHHGGGQESINYREILHVLDLAKRSGLPGHRVPMIFRGADVRLSPPASGNWYDTDPAVSDASDAILASVRGASPGNPVWVVPVGPGSNVGSAILQARAEGLDLKGRLRIIWLGGSNNAIIKEFNGNNDPWSLVVIARSGLETWIIPAPVGARVMMDKRTEGHRYADNPLGQYLKQIMPDRNKALYDASALSAIISERLGMGWVKETEWVTVAGPDRGYVWTRSDAPTTVRVIREIDQRCMQRDLFDTMLGKSTQLIGVANE
jgi:inosine-uridine nucleoside N-ribohydrolase